MLGRMTVSMCIHAKRGLTILAVLLVALASSQVYVAAEEKLKVLNEEYRIGPAQMFTPAKMTVQFSFTQNVSVNVASVGQSLYQTVISPQMVTFTTNASDQWTLDITIKYTEPTYQRILSGVWSNNILIISIEFPIVGKKEIQLQAKISTSKAPEYPKPEEIINGWFSRFDRYWTQYDARMQERQNQLTKQSREATDLTYAALGFGIASIAGVLYAVSRIREIDLLRRRRFEE